METQPQEKKKVTPKWYNMVGVWMMIIGGIFFVIIPDKAWWFFLIIVCMGLGGYYLTIYEQKEK